LLADQVPAHAAVDSAVRLARGHKKTAHMSGLINAVARKVAQLPSEEFKAEAPHPLPDWIRTRLMKNYGDAAVSNMEQVFAMDPPIDLTCKSPAAAKEWATRLNAEVLSNGSLRLQGKGQISAMPGFAEGEWWVQDAAAAMPVALLGDLNGLRVLDMCAAPGGKTMQLAAADGAVTALDVSEARLARVAENLGRTNLTAQLVAADALKWSPDQSFDIVVLDAPCSATGTMRRHPDLVYLREGQDLAPVLSLQERLLQRAAEWTAQGGRLLYCTCSLFPEEGEEQIKAFLEQNKDFKCEAPNASWLEAGWVSEEGFLRLRPDFWSDAKGMDGFFAAILHKI
jgi:16S rRNA (cytosine967-C5)-methyltransferase